MVCFSTLEKRLLVLHDVDAYFAYCRASYKTNPEDRTPKTFDLGLQRELDSFRELVARVERCGLSILLPAKPHSFFDEHHFLDIVFMLFWLSKESKIESHLKGVICRDAFYIKILTSHLQYCNSLTYCDPSNLLMAQYVLRYMNSESTLHVINSGFLQQLVLMLRSKRQHVLYYALDAFPALFCVKKKNLRKLLKILFSIEVGFGLALSKILRLYASNGLRVMTSCNCDLEFITSASQDCAMSCMTKLYQVIGVDYKSYLIS